MSAEQALSNLRHLYANLMQGTVRDTASAKRIATGLLGPAIEALERATPAPGAPAGFKPVPIKVTKAMQDAWDSAPSSEDSDADFTGAYQAMLDAAPGAPGQEVVSWQVRRTDGSPLACWETCTKDLYDLTLSTGRYCGFENGPPCEVRALGVIGAQEAAAVQAVGAWQDIATAPKDDSRVLLYRAEWCEDMAVGWWNRSGYWQPVGGNEFPDATHWMPLPPRPGAGEGS